MMNPLAAAFLLLGVAVTSGCGAAQQPSSACGRGNTEPASPWEDPVTLLDRFDGPSFSEVLDVEVDGDRVWFCSGVIGLNVYSAANPAALTFLDALAPSDGSDVYPRCQHLAVDGSDGRVYVTNRTSTVSRQSFVAVVDGAVPGALRELGSWTTDDNVEGIAVHGDLLLAAVHTHLVVLRRGAGAELTEIARLDGLGNAWTVRAAGDYAYVADAGGGLSVVDLSDPAAPERVGRLELDGAVKDLEVRGDRAVLAAGTAGLALVSLADPTEPRLIDRADTPGSALGVALGDEGLVLVADWNDLRVFDGFDGAALRPLGSEPLPQGNGDESRTLGIAARGTVVFSGNWTELVSYRVHPDRTAPDLNVSPRVALLPTVQGAPSGTVVVLSNGGSEPLAVEALEFGDDRLSTEDIDGPFTVAPGASERFVLELAEGTTEALASWINVVSDDPDEARKCIPVLANQDGIGLGEPAELATYRARGGSPQRLTELTQQGPVLLAYFATF
jgi:hypothetical protein